MAKRSRQARSNRYLGPGWYIHVKVATHRIINIDPENPRLLHVENIETSEPQILTIDELLRPAEDEEESAVFAPSLEELRQEIDKRFPMPAIAPCSDLPTHLLERAQRIIAIVDRVEYLIRQQESAARAQGLGFSRTEATRVAIANLNEPTQAICLATYYNYLHLYQYCRGDPAGIAASLHRRSWSKTKMAPAQLAFIDTLILRYCAGQRQIRIGPTELIRKLAPSILQRTGGLWIDTRQHGPMENLVDELLDDKLPMSAILDNPEKRAMLTPVKTPSLSWFYGYLRWFKHQPNQGEAVITERYGKEFWERELLVFEHFAARATFPTQFVFADHWLVNLFVVDEATRSQVDRLWLTLLIDVYSRSILGYALLYESPCIESIQTALQHAIWPKRSHTEAGIEGDWACWGIPQQLFLDNAWAHHSHSLENLSRAISCDGQYSSIDLVFRPPYRGRYGALIERVFGNFAAQIRARFPEAIRKNDPISNRNAAEKACLLYSDVDKMIQEMIVDYQHSPHRDLRGMTPHEKWNEGLALAYPLVPPQTRDVERLFWREYHQARAITNRGILAFGLQYRSPALAAAERVRIGNDVIKYSFHYQPSNIGCLALYRNGKLVCDVWATQFKLPNNEYQVVSRAEWEMAKAVARGEGRRPDRDWLALINKYRALVPQRQKEKQAATQKKGRGDKRSKSVDVQALDLAVQQRNAAQAAEEYDDLLLKFIGDANNS